MFLYTFMFGASISVPYLFLRSLNELHRSSAIGHAFIYPIFIHRILLFLSLADFPASEPVHVVGPLSATFLQQRPTHLRADPSVSRDASSSSIPPPPSSIGAAETPVVVLLLLMFLYRLLQMIQTFDVRWIMS